MKDLAALGGVRSRGELRFVAGAVGLAYVAPGASTSGARTSAALAPAFDLSVRTGNRVARSTAALSGVAGPPSVRYVSLTFGLDLGWLGQ